MQKRGPKEIINKLEFHYINIKHKMEAGLSTNKPSDLSNILKYDLYSYKLLFCEEKLPE